MPDEDYLKHNHLDETYEHEDNDNEPTFVQGMITALKANDNNALSKLSGYVPTDEADDFIGSMLVAGA